MENKDQINLIVKWKVKPGKLKTILSVLPELISHSQAEAGNLAYTAQQMLDDEQVIYLYESYTDADALAAHVQTNHYQQLVAETIIPLLEEREVIKLKPIMS